MSIIEQITQAAARIETVRAELAKMMQPLTPGTHAHNELDRLDSQLFDVWVSLGN